MDFEFGPVWFSLTTVISLSLTIGLNRPFGDKTAQTSFLPGTQHSLSVPLTRPTTGQLTSPSLKYLSRLRFVCEHKRLRLVKSSLMEENRGLVVTRDGCHTHYISPTSIIMATFTFIVASGVRHLSWRWEDTTLFFMSICKY